MTLLISLIGEQPIPNLLPIRHLNPDENLLVHTSNEKASLRPARRLRALIPNEQEVQLLKTPAYRVDDIRAQLKDALAGRVDVIFNLTGGTKLMALAAMEVARALKATCVYYRTESQPNTRGRNQQSKLYFYRFTADGSFQEFKSEILSPDLITLDDYLNAHLDNGYEDGSAQDDMERAVYEAIRDIVDEHLQSVRPKGVKEQVEIDLLVRRGNGVAAIEVKSGGEGSNKKAIDQLTTLAAREYLGTYATRFIVTRQDRDSRSNWYKALANALRIEVVTLRYGLIRGRLHEQDARNLRQRLDQVLPRKPDLMI